MQLRQYSLIFAEGFDAWRVVPRSMLVCYGWIVLQLYIWFKSIPTYVQEKCDPSILQMALGNHMTLMDAKALACTVVDVVGGPTAAQSAFATTIIGLSAGIFGLYTATGRRWDGWEPNTATNSTITNANVSPEYDYARPTEYFDNGTAGKTTTEIHTSVVTGNGPSPEQANLVKVPDSDVEPQP